RFSTSTVGPCALLICSPRSRARISALPPAGNGTTILMVRAACDQASWPVSASNTIARHAARRLSTNIGYLQMTFDFSHCRAQAQNYPARPVTIVVPAAPGGTADFTARLLSEGLTRSLGVQFLVENKSGASGNLGNTAVARAASDGYTLLLSYSGFHVTNPAL